MGLGIGLLFFLAACNQAFLANNKFCNDERPHRTLEFYTPSLAYQMNRELKRKWKNYYKKYETITE